MTGLLQKIVRSLERDRDLPVAARALKSARFVKAVLMAPYHLRAATAVGRRARTIGKPVVINRGTMEIGDDFIMNSQYAPCELSTASGGVLQIGARVVLNFGVTISAADHIMLGDESSVGPYSLLIDREPGAVTRPGIEIGARVWIAAHVTVLPGARIGAGTVITAGSVVAGDIPAGVVAGGIPARVLRAIDSGDDRAEPADHGPELQDAAGPEKKPWHGFVVSDFAPGDLTSKLQNARGSTTGAQFLQRSLLIDRVVHVPFAEGAELPAPEEARRFGVVWTHAQSIVNSLVPSRSAADASVSVDAAVHHLRMVVARHCEQIRNVSGTCAVTFAITWTASASSAFAPGAAVVPGGAAWALGVANQALIEMCADIPNVIVLDGREWIDARTEAWGDTGWHGWRIPFSNEVFARAAMRIREHLALRSGAAAKLLVLDLEFEATVENNTLRGAHGHSAAEAGRNAAVLEFRTDLYNMVNAGLTLAILAGSAAGSVFDRVHDEQLTPGARARVHRIPRTNSSADLQATARALGFALPEVVFVSPNALDRDRIREQFPAVCVADSPRHPADFGATLQLLRCFDRYRTAQNYRTVPA